jgi:hypothetical protein
LPIKAVAAFNGDELPVFSIRSFWMTGSFVSTGFEDESVFIAGAGFETVGWFIGRLEVVLTTRDDLCKCGACDTHGKKHKEHRESDESSKFH